MQTSNSMVIKNLTDKKLLDITPGIYDMPNELYHSGAGISRSAIMEFKRSPMHYWFKYINPDRVKKEASDAMEFGSAFHMYVLEPELFEKEYFVMVKCPHHGNTKEAKAYKAQQEALSSGKKIILDTDLKVIKAMTDGLYNHPRAFSLITGAQYEKSIFWIDEASGLLCKARPDIWNEKANFVLDLKTTKDASKRKFSYDFQDNGNYIQCAMIRDGILKVTGKKVESFLNLAVEKDAPYCAAHYPVNSEYVDLGEQEYKHYLLEIKKCMETNEWQAYKDDVIDVPKYLVSEWQA